MAGRHAVAFLVCLAVVGFRCRDTYLAADPVSQPGTITAVAGSGKVGFSGDSGPATQAELNYPWDITLDAAGNLYISDLANHRLRKVAPGGIISTVAGESQGYSG